MAKQTADRVVIVGAGPGGLASAMLLARAGARVTVLERRDRVGGRTSAIEEQGYRFDLGPTFFLYPQVLETVFRMCGRDLNSELELLRLDPNYALRFEDGSAIHATNDVERMEKEIARLSPDDAQGLRGYLADNRAKLEAFQPILESPFQGWRDFLKLPFFKLLPLMRPWAAVDSDLARHFQDPRVRLAFSFQSKYLGMSPYRCPSLFTILSFIEYEFGVYHPRGGCNEISAAMARACVEMGVDVRLEEPVEGIDFEGRRAVGVRTARGTIPCDALVVNADFARAMHRLVPDGLRRKWTNKRIAKKRFSCSTFMMYLGIEGRYDDLDHHTIFLTDDYQQNLRDIEANHVLSDNPSLYVQNASVTDSSLAPEGHSTLYVLIPVTHQHENVDWSNETHRYREVAMRQLRKLGLEDLEQRIRYEKILTPAGWDQDLEIHLGATFNLAHSLDQMLHFRPRNRFDELDGVYLVGGGTHPGSGLPVIFESARITSRLLADDLGLDATMWSDRPVPSHDEPVLVPAHV